MRDWRRVLLAAAAAPFAAMPAVFIGILAVYLGDLIRLDMLTPNQIKELGQAVDLGFGLAFIGVFTGWLLMPILGIPTFVILRLAGLDHAIPCALVGAIFGVLQGTGFGREVEPFSLVTMTACGAFVAGAFSMIVNRPRTPPEPLRYFE